jgi:hypothetical protein
VQTPIGQGPLDTDFRKLLDAIRAKDAEQPPAVDRELRDSDAMRDNVNHPAHYTAGRRFEPLEVIIDWELSFCLGTVLKYVSRAGRKGDAIEDLKKARTYLNREIRRLQEEGVRCSKEER